MNGQQSQFTIGTLVLAFVAGAIAVLTAHQALLLVLLSNGVIAPARPPFPPNTAWATYGVPPFGVPRVVSQAFWGGVWGIVLAAVLGRTRGLKYWLSWIVLAAILQPLVQWYVFDPLRGLPSPTLDAGRTLASGSLGAAWGFAAALLMSFIPNLRR